MPDYNKLDQIEQEVRQQNSGVTPFNVSGEVPLTQVDNRYPTYFIGLNNEDIYGQNQPTIEKWKNGAKKFAATTTTTFINGTAGLANGVYQWAKDGKFSSFYDNEFNRSLDNYTQNLEQTLPNYYTDAETNASILSPNTWFTANFWADTVLKNFGYAAGAYLSGGTWSKTIGSALSATSKAIAGGGAAELAQASESANLLGRSAESFNRLNVNLNNTAQRFNTLYKASDFGANFTRAGIAAVGEASIEALHAREDYRTKLINEYRDRWGLEPDAENLSKIDSLSDEIGNLTYGANLALLTTTNLIQFPKITGTFWKSQRANLAMTTRGLGDIIEEGEDVLSRTFSVSRRGRISKVLSGLRTAGRFVFSPSEAFEEGTQSVIPISITDYVEKGKRGENTDIYDSIVKGIGDTLSSKEGQLSILTGGLAGGLMEIGGSVRNIRNRVTRNQRTEAFTRALNSANSTGFIKSNVESIQRGEILNHELNQALLDNDRLNYEDIKTDLNLNYLLTRIQGGRYDLVKDDINGYIDMANTSDGWARLIDSGIANDNMNQTDFINNVRQLGQLAQTINSQYEALNNRYGVIVDTNGNKPYTPDILFQMAYGASKIEDYNRRINELLPQVPSPSLGLPYYMERASNGQLTQEDIETLNDRIESMPNASPEYITDAKEISSDILELSARRRNFIDQYEQLRDFPDQYKTPARTVTPDEVTLETPTDVEPEQNEGDYQLVQLLAEDLSNGIDISQDTEALQLQQNYPQLLEFYLNQLREQRTAPKMQFVQDNEGQIFTFQGEEGTLSYNPNTDQILFNGQIEITNQDFNTGTITSLDEINDTTNYLNQIDNRTEIVNRNRTIATFQNRLNQTNQRLDEVNERIQNRKEELQNIDNELRVENWKAEELVAKKKGWFPQFIETIDVLTQLRDETQTELDNLTQEQSDLEAQRVELENLINNPPSNLQSSIDLLENQISQLESLTLQNGEQINSLNKIIEDTQSLIGRLQNIIRTKLETFQRNNPLIPSVETAIRAIDQNSPEVVRILRDQIQQIENFEIAPARVRENQTRGQIQDLYREINNYDKQIKAKQAILNQINNIQGEVQTRSNIEQTITPQDIATDNVIEATEEITTEPVTIEYEGAQKTDENVYRSTILLTTREERQSTPWYNKWEQFTQKYTSFPKNLKENARMLLITANNEDSLGVSGLVNYMYKNRQGKDFFKTKEQATNAQDGAVIATLTEFDPETNEYYFIDQIGNRLGKVGEEVNIRDLVVNKMPSSSTSYATSNQQRAAQKSSIPLSERARAWEDTREEIIDSEVPRYSRFTLSRGSLNTERGVENSPQPIVNNLINEDQINDDGLIQVSTSDNNFEITVNNRKYKQPKGSAWVISNNNFQQIVPRNLNEEEVNRIYDLLKLLKSNNQEQNTDIINYLQGLFYFNTTDNYGVLNLNGETFTLLEGDYLEQDEERLKNALRNTRTSVNNDLVKENQPFKEIISINNDQLEFAHWQTYQGFLLSPTYNTVDNIQGEREPTIQTRTNSSNFIDKYAILENVNAESNNREETEDTIIEADELPSLNICE